MALSITDAKITSPDTPHTAILVEYTGAEEGTGWSVSWLPGQLLDRNQAITAMTIAEAAGSGIVPGDVSWTHVEGWAAELGMDARTAVRLTSVPPCGTA